MADLADTNPKPQIACDVSSIISKTLYSLASINRLASYSSYIAHVTHKALEAAIGEKIDIIRNVTAPIQRDGTYAFTTTKSLEVTDFQGTRYRVTVENLTEVERSEKRKAGGA
jgi:hypothetical protein